MIMVLVGSEEWDPVRGCGADRLKGKAVSNGKRTNGKELLLLNVVCMPSIVLHAK